jgi:hypothetical protein
LAYTSDDLTAIRTARQRGLRSVQFADRMVMYQSDAEMRQLEQDILRELNGTRHRPKQTIVVADKGFR